MAKAQFDHEQVVRQAMLLFWKKGYAGGSMQLIVKATGLKPGSIYLAFGNKDGLYQAALDAYFQQTLNTLRGLVQQSDSAATAICRFLDDVAEQSSVCSYQSCFLIRTRLELAPDSELHAYSGQLLKQIELRLAGYLKQDYGDRADDYAASVMLHIFGTRVYGYHRNSEATLKAALRQGLSWLPWD